MPDPHASDSEPRPPRPARSLLSRLKALLRPAPPADRDDIRAVLEAAHDHSVLDGESYAMISGALAVADKTVADIMVPRSRMDLLDISRPLPELMPAITDTGHSRFPVYEDDRDNIIGVLLAKDLLLALADHALDIRALVRPPVFIPESKRLNELLHEFRVSRNHLAIVIDEHGGICGLVTMEDVLEQIVGDIEDEFDDEAEKTIFRTGENSWRAMGTAEIEDFNETFGVHLPDEDVDTLNGWLAAELGHIPRRGERLERHGLVFTVVSADGKRARWLHIQRLDPTPPASEHAA
ncbi:MULTISPECIES: HlyC/CorC family transporter [Castellaniella]|uniref:HlyC/CorC family transporter n=1 Tax=Castellaniella TaxID=359336 RepID=UPI002D7E3F13|nr:transporter associated domain-containing protein [Castellaniella sp.]HET8703282.1 transporter associated domain-containing protein [Castellaniella sp.]